MERDFLKWLRERVPPDRRLAVGIGDDAAVLRQWLSQSQNLVVTADLLADGTHFQLDEAGPRRVGRKALAVNLSDLAAMAARPIAFVISLLLPRSDGGELAKELYEGLLPLAEQFDVAMAGGDTNAWDGALVIDVTAFGETTAGGPLLRSGARPGDAMIVTGDFGGSLLGKHLDFTPRVAEALQLHQQFTLHAGMDVSDGLLLDLSRICHQSGCGAVIDTTAVPVSLAAQELASRSGEGKTALDRALSDGEDFELLLAVEPASADKMLAQQPLAVPLTKIGHFTAQRGLQERLADGSLRNLTPNGYEHR